ncbi:uncharacterized protein LOC119662276 [Teleopsis dalmanni]|uniref:uncharacterized protein LOC119662276 n=1 Tax=Teleopsis dalmanni TaxID=139649 RepID=UPI0018CF36B4|nr:uncharacterized protein LOC119662276 [Teleopsis dalmanni]
MTTLLTTSTAIKKIDKIIADRPQAQGIKPIKVAKLSKSCTVTQTRASKTSKTSRTSRNSSYDEVGTSQRANQKSSSGRSFQRINYIQRNIDAIKERKSSKSTDGARRSLGGSDLKQKRISASSLKTKKKPIKEFPRRPIYKRNMFGKRIDRDEENSYPEEYYSKDVEIIYTNLRFQPNVPQSLCSAGTIIKHRDNSDPCLVYSRQKLKLNPTLTPHKSMMNFVNSTQQEKNTKVSNGVTENNDSALSGIDLCSKSLHSIFHYSRSGKQIENTSSCEKFDRSKVTPKTIDNKGYVTGTHFTKLTTTCTARTTQSNPFIALVEPVLPSKISNIAQTQGLLEKQIKTTEKKKVEKLQCQLCRKSMKVKSLEEVRNLCNKCIHKIRSGKNVG